MDTIALPLRCCYCTMYLPSSAFIPTNRRDGYGCRCRACDSERSRMAYRKTHPQRLPACRVCGTTENLRRTTMCAPCDNARATALYRAKVPYVDTSPRVCAYESCNDEFKPTQQANAMYCSNQCKQHAYMRRKGWAGPKPKQERQPRPVEIRSLIFPKTCQCGRTFVARQAIAKWCSPECSRQHKSDKLMGLYRAAVHNINVPSAMHWLRTLCRYLADRDGHNCGICGRHVDIDKPSGTRGKDGHKGPSVDHIIPTSKGGGDELENLRLTHWGCNRRRGNRGTHEQLKLAA